MVVVVVGGDEAVEEAEVVARVAVDEEVVVVDEGGAIITEIRKNQTIVLLRHHKISMKSLLLLQTPKVNVFTAMKVPRRRTEMTRKMKNQIPWKIRKQKEAVVAVGEGETFNVADEVDVTRREDEVGEGAVAGVEESGDVVGLVKRNTRTTMRIMLRM